MEFSKYIKAKNANALLLGAALERERHRQGVGGWQVGLEEGAGVLYFSFKPVFLLSVFHLVALWQRIFKCEEVSLAQIQPIL